MKEKGSSFSGSIGFVLAAAGSAVGVGNIWRFPYLCAKDGGGLFLLVYLVLVLTFGFVLLTTDVAIGRKTKKNALRAFEELNPKWKFLGRLTFLVPVLIMTYYSVIGGWISKYLFVYLVSDGTEAAADGYFTSFITSDIAPIVFMLIFLALTAWIVFRGVEKGIEKFSKIIMPGLILLIVIISIFCLTLSHTAAGAQCISYISGSFIYIYIFRPLLIQLIFRFCVLYFLKCILYFCIILFKMLINDLNFIKYLITKSLNFCQCLSSVIASTNPFINK